MCFQAVTELSHAVVGDKSKPVEDAGSRCGSYVHCVQDMHQPCHVGENHDKGGNLTRIRGSTAVPTSTAFGIPASSNAGKSEDFWLADLAELDTAENRKAWMAVAVEEWDTESLLRPGAAYVVPGTEGNQVRPEAIAGSTFVAILRRAPAALPSWIAAGGGAQ